MYVKLQPTYIPAEIDLLTPKAPISAGNKKRLHDWMSNDRMSNDPMSNYDQMSNYDWMSNILNVEFYNIGPPWSRQPFVRTLIWDP
jgi:hypothetical protein